MAADSVACCHFKAFFLLTLFRLKNFSSSCRSRCRLGIPTCMVLCAEKDIWHKAISKRQQVMQEHESMARTAFQMSAELVSLKAS